MDHLFSLVNSQIYPQNTNCYEQKRKYYQCD